MRNTKRRMLRLVTAVGLAGAILAGPAGIGGAQVAAQENQSFAGSSTGYALRVSLDLRPLDNLLGGLVTELVGPVVEAVSGQPFNGVIDQYIIRTTSEADSNGVHRARSTLAEGLINLDSIEATAIGQVVEQAFQEVDGIPLLGGTLGGLKATVVEGPAVAGDGILHQLGVDIGEILATVDVLGLLNDQGLGAVLDDLAQTVDGLLQPVLVQLLELVEGVLGEVGLVDDLVDTVCEVVGGLPLLGDLVVICEDDDAGVTEVLAGLISAQAIVDLVQDLLQGGLLDGVLATINGLVNNTAAAQLASGTAVSRSAATIEEIDILGGLVGVDLFNLFSRSEADGTPGSAKNTADCSIADVNIGDGDILSLSFDGSSITVMGEEVPLVGDLVGTVKGIVDEILFALGIEVGLCETAKVEADPQGLFAAQSVSALRVAVAPLGLFSLVIDPTVQTAVALQPQAAPPVAAPPSGEVELPKTGAAHLATMLSGLALVGAALLVRRRLI